MSVEEIGPMTPVSTPDSPRRESFEEERIRQEEEREARRREEELRREHQIDEFA